MGGTIQTTCMLVQTSVFVLNGPESSEVCEVQSALWVREDRANPLGSPWKIWNMGTLSISFSPQGKRWDLGFFSLSLCAELGGGTVTSVYKLFKAFFSWRFPIRILACQHSDSGKIETSPLGGPRKNKNIVHMVQSSPSLPREDLGAGDFLSVVCVMLCWGGPVDNGECLGFS